MTRIRVIDGKHPETEIIEEAAAILKNGGLVAFPTETVYGLGADALLPEGAKRIYAAKGRPSDNPLIVHIADFESLYKIARDIPPQAKALADAFWPGPLTMIFHKKDIVPCETTGGLDTVAVRMPSHPVALALIRASGGYIAAPSANTSGRPSPTCAKHVQIDLDGRIPLILDGGEVEVGIESTIIDLSCLDTDTGATQGGVPMILRPGYITREMLAAVVGEVQNDPGLNFAKEADPGAGTADTKEQEQGMLRPKAPGMKYKHYAPRADMIIISGAHEAVVEEINRLAAKSREQGELVGIICTDETAGAYQADVIKRIGSRMDEDSIAKHLYAILRDFDDLGVDRIYSESFSTPRLGQAIMNRLLKAAGHQVIEV